MRVYIAKKPSISSFSGLLCDHDYLRCVKHTPRTGMAIGNPEESLRIPNLLKACLEREINVIQDTRKRNTMNIKDRR